MVTYTAFDQPITYSEAKHQFPRGDSRRKLAIGVLFVVVGVVMFVFWRQGAFAYGLSSIIGVAWPIGVCLLSVSVGLWYADRRDILRSALLKRFAETNHLDYTYYTTEHLHDGALFVLGRNRKFADQITSRDEGFTFGRYSYVVGWGRSSYLYKFLYTIVDIPSTTPDFFIHPRAGSFRRLTNGTPNKPAAMSQMSMGSGFDAEFQAWAVPADQAAASQFLTGELQNFLLQYAHNYTVEAKTGKLLLYIGGTTNFAQRATMESQLSFMGALKRALPNAPHSADKWSSVLGQPTSQVTAPPVRKQLSPWGMLWLGGIVVIAVVILNAVLAAN